MIDVKRVVDLMVTVPGLILALPLMVAVGGFVASFLGRPIFFRQVRPGLHGRPFTLIKFRSLRDATDADGTPLPDGERITRFGRILRSTSLDELPELWNVLRGDMSLVGPRPLLPEYLDLYSTRQARRHEVKPGITGWAQVNGRNALSWEDRLEMDVWYVENQTLWLDFKILALTVIRVLGRDGVTQEGEVTMQKFGGAKASRVTDE